MFTVKSVFMQLYFSFLVIYATELYFFSCSVGLQSVILKMSFFQSESFVALSPRVSVDAILYCF